MARSALRKKFTNLKKYLFEYRMITSDRIATRYSRGTLRSNRIGAAGRDCDFMHSRESRYSSVHHSSDLETLIIAYLVPLQPYSWNEVCVLVYHSVPTTNTSGSLALHFSPNIRSDRILTSFISPKFDCERGSFSFWWALG